MPKYRKKPVIIDAERYAEHHVAPSLVVDPAIDRLVDGVHWEFWRRDRLSRLGDRDDEGVLVISTPDGDQVARFGDYIVKNATGELFPCKPGIFEMTYEPAEDV